MTQIQTGSFGQFRASAERTIYTGPELQLSQVEVELADGDRLWWDTVRLLRTVAVALVDEGNRVLVLHRKRLTTQRWGWELPSGVIDEDEEPAEAAVRELAELTGYRAGRLKLACHFQPAPRTVDGEHLIFIGKEPVLSAEGSAAGGVESSAAGNAPPFEWLSLRSVTERISSGQIWDSATLVALLGLLAGTW